MTYTSTFDTAVQKLDPKKIVQELANIPAIEQKVLTEIFKRKFNHESTSISRKLITDTIMSIPYSSAGSFGVAINGESETYDTITVPPMKAHMRILADEFDEVRELKGTDYNGWLRTKLEKVKKTISYNREWYARHFLATGQHDYKMKIGNVWHAVTYSLGTLPAVLAPSVLFDNASATLVGVVQHLDSMRAAGIANNDAYFQDLNQIKIYAVTAVWNAIYALLNDRSKNDVIGSARNGDDLVVGPYTITKFDATIKDPETQASAAAITAKTMRMIDTSQNAPHTLTNLRLSNLKATGSQRHVLINQEIDKSGDFVDVNFQYRPCGLFIPDAMVTTAAVIA